MSRLILEGVSGFDIMSQKSVARLVCLDMDRVLVDHLSTWQYVYDNLGISNDESFQLYNQGLLDEWDWIKLDIALIKESRSPDQKPLSDSDLRASMEGMPMMKNWEPFIQALLDNGYHVAIVSGGLQQTARDIAAQFPSRNPWERPLNFQAEILGSDDGAESTPTPHNDLPTATILDCMFSPMGGYWVKKCLTEIMNWMISGVIRFKWMVKVRW